LLNVWFIYAAPTLHIEVQIEGVSGVPTCASVEISDAYNYIQFVLLFQTITGADMSSARVYVSAS
jgi:hypothetical protein